MFSTSNGRGRWEAAEEPLSQQGVQRRRRRRSNRTPAPRAALGRSQHSGARQQQQQQQGTTSSGTLSTSSWGRWSWGGGSGPPAQTWIHPKPLFSSTSSAALYCGDITELPWKWEKYRDTSAAGSLTAASMKKNSSGKRVSVPGTGSGPSRFVPVRFQKVRTEARGTKGLVWTFILKATTRTSFPVFKIKDDSIDDEKCVKQTNNKDTHSIYVKQNKRMTTDMVIDYIIIP